MKRINMQATGESIKVHCEQAGLTPKDLSRVLNLDISTIYYWFQGKSLPRFDTAYSIADLCKCDMSDLIVLKEDTEDVD